MDKQKIVGILTSVIEDCQIQADSLQKGDVSWDCYDIDNWQSIADSLNEVMIYIKETT